MTAQQSYLEDDEGRRYDIDKPRWCGSSGSPLRLGGLTGIGSTEIDVTKRSLWRYASALALHYDSPVTLGEGCTPLLRRNWRGRDFLFKLEWFNPSGSFKDRGNSLVVSTIAAQGITEVLSDSSGNGGSSLSAYCAAAGIKARILVPDSTSGGKVLQARAYGAEVELVPGTREDVAREAIRRSADVFYASHNWHPFFLDGVKTIGYELWEDLQFRAPDNILVVAGAGSLVLGCDAAFGELIDAGSVKQRPRLLVAQPASCCPIYHAFHGTSKKAKGRSVVKGLAEGAAISEPVRLGKVVDAVRRSRGTIVSVSESDIVQATRELAVSGLYVEPTSAVAMAAVEQLEQEGWIEDGAVTAVILTGTGLKTTDAISLIMSGSGALQ